MEKVNDRWEICICVREGRFDQVIIVSFGITVRISFLNQFSVVVSAKKERLFFSINFLFLAYPF